MKKIIISLLVFACLSMQTSLAQLMIKPGTCELIVAARSTLAEARTYVSNEISDTRFTKIFKAPNGWYAISIGALKPHEEQPVMSDWKASGKIPSDAYCSTGESYLALYDWRTGNEITGDDRQNSAISGSGKVSVQNNGYLNLREGPSNQYNVVQKMHTGSSVNFIETNGSWYKIKHESGVVGWASGQYLEKTNISSSSQASSSSKSSSASSRLSAADSLALAALGLVAGMIDSFNSPSNPSNNSSSAGSDHNCIRVFGVCSGCKIEDVKISGGPGIISSSDPDAVCTDHQGSISGLYQYSMRTNKQRTCTGNFQLSSRAELGVDIHVMGNSCELIDVFEY